MVRYILSFLLLIAVIYQPSYSQQIIVPGLDPYQSGFRPVKKDGKWGYKNSVGKLIIGYQFDQADRFQDGAAIVTEHGKVGMINSKGEMIVPLGKYRWIDDFQNGLARVTDLDSLYGFINSRGKEIIPCEYKSADGFASGLCQVGNNNGVGYINTSGKVIIPLIYDQAMDPFLPYISEIKVEKNGKWGILSMRGKVLVKPIYDEIHSVVDGMRLVKKNGKFGYLNSKDKLVIACKYDKAYPFSEGKAFVELNGRSGTVNKSGKEKWIKD